MNKHPFLSFGLPFIAVIVAGSFVLTPATAVRYERHDRKVRQMTKEEELNVRRSARKVDMKEEYYVGILPSLSGLEEQGLMQKVQRVLTFAQHIATGWQGLGELGTEAC